MKDLVSLIQSESPEVRNTSVDGVCSQMTFEELRHQCRQLEQFRRRCDNLYHRVRSLLFLYTIHRFHLPMRSELPAVGRIPYEGYELLLQRRFEESIERFLSAEVRFGPNDGISSALAAAYHRLAFQTLADQVRRSVRSVRGNQWMFRMGHPSDQPLRIRKELVTVGSDGTYPILREMTAVRMDLTHSAWSDIFFLGMDYPEGAKVLNISVDLGVFGRDTHTSPPVSAWFRVLDEPVLRLTSVDLGATADIVSLADVFDFGKDYLGLLKAAVIASGLVPPGVEGSGQNLEDLLARMVGPGRGIELASHVQNIPKGSRLAVSTNLLGSLIAVCMRATSQAKSLSGPLDESERRLVLARALLGEWLGGSGGGWQDSGGVWPGVKLIQGVQAVEGDPEYGISRGRLMPSHRLLSVDEISGDTRKKLQESLILVHGGMAQNVGPILEMVTEKYLLRCEREWVGRQAALRILDSVLDALKAGDIQALGRTTTENFKGPIQTIIPWATNAYTESLIRQAESAFGDDFWGFWMLGGMSGGGMGFMVAPHRRSEAQKKLQEIMSGCRASFKNSLPFAMEPVVFDYTINENGTSSELLQGDDALMPSAYYPIRIPDLLRRDRNHLAPTLRAELDKFGKAARTRAELRGMVQSLFDVLLPRGKSEDSARESLDLLLQENGFDKTQHDKVRADMKEGRIGLAQNRLRADTQIQDVRDEDVIRLELDSGNGTEFLPSGTDALSRGEVAVVTLAAGAGSRWTQGAGVCKALHPFCKFSGKHRSFLELHLAKSRRTGRRFGIEVPHVFTTSYLTHRPISEYTAGLVEGKESRRVHLSQGRSVGLRVIPTERDLRFQWEESVQQVLDEQQQKVRDSIRHALLSWARNKGETTDYTDNLPLQCLHPIGHFYEVPNLLRNGVLARLLQVRPQLKYLMLHNIDTCGVDLDPRPLGAHIASGACLSFEVIPRRLEDRGGGLARVNGQVRILEGLALPNEEQEFELSFYNTMTTWIDIDQFLGLFGMNRAELLEMHDKAEFVERVSESTRAVAARLPTYVTLKEVKKRWGHGQEDVFPVAQYEKLWSDLSALPELRTGYLAVPRWRGQQLKDQAQLDGWFRDGSAAIVGSLCDWD